VLVATFGHGYYQRTIYWNEEPFQKAAKSEWRHGCFYVAIMPVVFVAFMRICALIPNSVANSFFNSGYATILLWAGFVVVVFVGGFALIKITPKIPLSVSIPIGVVTWPLCMWYAVAHWVMK
jgi:hypothetical protein